MNPILLCRHPVTLVPESARVIIRPFIPADHVRITTIIGRVLALTEEEAVAQLTSVRAEFDARHYDIEPLLMAHFEKIHHLVFTQRPLSHERKMLLGSVFSGEYSLESAAIFNPSMVPHTDQTNAPAGGLRFIMSLRATEEIRERLAIAYSPGVGASTSDTFAGYGSIFVQALTRPESFTAFYDAVNAITASLRDTPITEDELNRARLPEVERLKRTQAGNEYWLGQLSGVAANPADVDQILTHISDLEAITVADIQRAARQYLRAETAWRGVSVSDNPAAPPAAAQ